MNMDFRKILLSSLLLLVAVLSQAQTRQGRITKELLDSIARPPMDVDSSIVFDFTEVSISIKDTDSPRTLVFPFENRGRDELIITRMSGSCGCTVPRYSTSPVQPGGRGEVSIVYNPHNQTGRIDRAVYVYTDASEIHPVVRLSVKGEIVPADRFRGYPVALGTLRVKRSEIDFGKIGPTSRRSERIMCVNSGDKPLTVSAMKGVTPGWVSVRTVPGTIAPGEEAELYVEIDGAGIPARTQGSVELRVVLDGISAPPSRRSLKLLFSVE